MQTIRITVEQLSLIKIFEYIYEISSIGRVRVHLTTATNFIILINAKIEATSTTIYL